MALKWVKYPLEREPTRGYTTQSLLMGACGAEPLPGSTALRQD
jgi:hypothetical protein